MHKGGVLGCTLLLFECMDFRLSISVVMHVEMHETTNCTFHQPMHAWNCWTVGMGCGVVFECMAMHSACIMQRINCNLICRYMLLQLWPQMLKQQCLLPLFAILHLCAPVINCLPTA